MRVDTGSGTRFTVVAARWDLGWDVFLLDRHGSLIGQTRSSSRDDVERAARRLLEERAVSDALTLPLTMIFN